MIKVGSFQKKTIIGGAIASAWVVISLIVLGMFGVHHAWPALLTILFYAEHRELSNVPNIFIGAACGLLLGAIMPAFVGLMMPLTGVMVGRLIAAFVVIFAIIVLKDVLPMFFNHYNLVYFTVALIFVKDQQTLSWIAILFGGGLLLTGGFIVTARKTFKVLGMN